MKTLLSYTTISDYLQANHTYICKQLGCVKPETEAMLAGREAHQVLQGHLLGEIKLPIDLDWNCTDIEYHARKDADEEYQFHSYLDGVNWKSKVAFEIKTSGSNPWGQGQFNSSIQPKYYSWITGLKKFVFITCKFDLSGLKVFYKEMTDQDWKEAEDWAMKALKGIKAGEFKGGLDEKTGKCLGCNYQQNCHFL